MAINFEYELQANFEYEIEAIRNFVLVFAIYNITKLKSVVLTVQINLEGKN